MQWIWKQCVHRPQTKGQSSPGSLQSGQQPSKATLQMPHVSSLATHFQAQTPFQLRNVTFSLVFRSRFEADEAGFGLVDIADGFDPGWGGVGDEVDPGSPKGGSDMLLGLSTRVG